MPQRARNSYLHVSDVTVRHSHHYGFLVSLNLIKCLPIFNNMAIICKQSDPDMETSTPMTPNSKARRPQSAGIPRSPRLSRSSSGASTASPSESRGTSPYCSTNRVSSVSLPEIRASRSATSSPRQSVHRSRSIIKTRSATKEEKDEESYNNIPISKVIGSPRRRLSLDSKDSKEDHNNANQSNLARLFRSNSHNTISKAVGRSLIKSPSAWALSPGRPLSALPLAPESPKVKTVSGVLKYFNKQKKVSSAQEEEFHQYKIMHSRLLQWRFANAKAEAAMATVRRKAEERVFGVWLKLYKMRYTIAEKRMKVERLKQKVKFLEILCPQLELLNEWEKLEKKNCEAVGRVTRKLSAYSTKLPLVDGATADIVSVYDAMKLALEVIENIEDTIIDLQNQSEKASNMLRELVYTVNQNVECFQDLEKEIASVMSLEAHEKSLVVHLLQEYKEPEESQRNCKQHLMRSFKNKETALIFSMLNVS